MARETEANLRTSNGFLGGIARDTGAEFEDGGLESSNGFLGGEAGDTRSGLTADTETFSAQRAGDGILGGAEDTGACPAIRLGRKVGDEVPNVVVGNPGPYPSIGNTLLGKKFPPESKGERWTMGCYRLPWDTAIGPRKLWGTTWSDTSQ